MRGADGMGFATFPYNITVHGKEAKKALDAFFNKLLEFFEWLRNGELSQNYEEVVSLTVDTFVSDEEKEKFLDEMEKCFADILDVCRTVRHQIVHTETFPEEIDGREGTILLCAKVGIQAHYMHACVGQVQCLRKPLKKDADECECFTPRSPRYNCDWDDMR